MKKIMYLYENCKMPLRVTYFAFILVAFGFLIQNENVNIFYTFNNKFILMLAEASLSLGKTIILNLPLIFMIYLVCKKANSGIPVVLAFLGYFSFLVSASLFIPQNLSSSIYTSSSSINSLLTININGKYAPETGLIGSFIVAYITRFSFIRSRHRTQNSILGFLNKDSAAIIYNIVFCFLAGIVVAYVFPFIYTYLNNLITYISTDLNDPYRMFIYGLLDRVSAILGLGSLVRSPFWYTSLGGTYQTVTGQLIVGDVNIWPYVKDTVNTYFGCGRFITPYYVINMFICPSIFLGIYTSMSDKKERHHYILPLILTSLLSIVCGNPLPMELMLLFTCPLLLVAYIVVAASVFAFMTKYNIYLGSSIVGSDVFSAMPGSFPDFIINLRSVVHFDTLLNILFVGLAAFAICFVLAYFYFHHLAFNLVNQSRDKKLIEDTIEAIGGFDNIEKVGSGLFKVNFVLNDNEAANFDKIRDLSIVKMYETRDGISMEFGSSSLIIAKMINDKKKENERKNGEKSQV